MAPPRIRRLAGALLAACVCGTLLGGCTWRRVRLWPRPMRAVVDPLPPGDSADHPAGPEEVSVLRHADPVSVRPTGALSGFPLAFYAKRMRLTAGGSVIVGPAGRAEVLWPSGSSIVLFGRGVGWIGSPSRGEPIFEFQDVERGRLDLMPGDRVQLVGGSVLAGESGPYMINRTSEETLRVRNQSKASMQLAFREEVFSVDPGQSILLPLLTSGGTPRSADLGLERVSGPGFSVGVRGPLDATPGPAGVDVVAREGGLGERELHGLGVRVRLEAGQRASFRSLGDAANAAASPAPVPEPAAGPDPVQAERGRLQAAIAAQEALQSGLGPGDPTFDQAQAQLDALRAELAALEAAGAPPSNSPAAGDSPPGGA